VFVPAKQHARLAIEMTQPFVWPSDKDSAYVDELRAFVKERLVNVEEFVLFDQASHAEVRLPERGRNCRKRTRASY